MNENIIRLFNRVEVVKTGRIGPLVPSAYVHNLNATIAALGYTFDRDVMQALLSGTEEDFVLFTSELVRALTSLTGANQDYQVLFAGFPYDTPDQHRYLISRVVGLLRNHVGYTKPVGLLPCGHVIDPDLFDISRFGACPICQFQVPGIRSAENVLIEYQPLATPLKLLGLADGDFLTGQANALFVRPASMSKDERSFLISRLFQTDPPLDVPLFPFRETVPLAWTCLAMRGGTSLLKPAAWDVAARLIRSATDVLRLAVFLSDPDTGDLSLAEPTRFKLTTSRKKIVLRLLDALDRPEEDMLLHAERWKKLSLVLKPGTAKHRTRFPHAARAFDFVMRHPKDIPTFNRKAERLLKIRDVPAYANHLSQRPGEFLRKLDAMLRRLPINQGDWNDVLVPMIRAVPRVPTAMLFTMIKYLEHRGYQDGGDRVFRPKGPNSRIMVVKDTRPKVPKESLLAAISLINQDLDRRFRDLPPLGNVWIDPELFAIPLPSNRRGDSSASSAVFKGMRWRFSADAEVLRLFVWWKGGIDVDLSITMLDRNFNGRGHVGFTNLEESGCIHSGDIQNAPEGAAEFIDVPIRHMTEEGTRYLCMSVISFRGQTFDSFPCFCGFMERDAVKSGQRFEPDSVRLKIDVTAKSTGAVPLVFDLVERRMIYADLATGNGRHASALLHDTKFRTLSRAVIEAPRRMPTVGDVLAAHVRVRGTAVHEPEYADVVWSADRLDWEEIYRLLD